MVKGGLYLSCLILMAWSMNLSCVNVYIVIWMFRVGACRNEPDWFCVAHCIYIKVVEPKIATFKNFCYFMQVR